MGKSQKSKKNPPHDKLSRIGQQHELKTRTQDIALDDDTTFRDLTLTSQVLDGLRAAGFKKPSPIQIHAIPLGRCGLDLVVQAKSGTGKTCVFTIIALESIDLTVHRPQVIVLAPTREIALQIQQVFEAIGSAMVGLHCHSCIGGLPLQVDKQQVKRCHIIIGTPGRIKQLMELESLNTESVRLFILDEADKLMDESFQQQINWIYSGLPESKQVVAASATYTEALVKHLCNYMQNPTCVRLNSSDPVLLGVRQYKKLVEDGDLPNACYNNKVKEVIKVLSQANFQQCLIFSNLQTRGWRAAHIAGCQEQTERMEAMARLKTYDCRILISTDLTSRGIDADRVDMVINLDLPIDCETYLHRVGRAGRFGANGAAVSFITPKEVTSLDAIASKINTHIAELPEILASDFIENPQKLTTDPKTVQVESFQVISSESIPSSPNTSESNIMNTDDPVNPNHDCSTDDEQVNCNIEPKATPNQDVLFANETQLNALTEELNFKSILMNHPDFMREPSIPNLVVNHLPPFRSLADAEKFMENPKDEVDKLKHVQLVDGELMTATQKDIQRYLDDKKILERLDELNLNELSKKASSSRVHMPKLTQIENVSSGHSVASVTTQTESASVMPDEDEQFWQEYADNYTREYREHTGRDIQQSEMDPELNITAGLKSLHQLHGHSEVNYAEDMELSPHMKEYGLDVPCTYHVESDPLSQTIASHYRKVYAMQAYISGMVNQP